MLVHLNSLSGDFVHDDIPAVVRNPDVVGSSSWLDLFANDFWGTPMHDWKSHKSYRPVTVATFRYSLTASLYTVLRFVRHYRVMLLGSQVTCSSITYVGLGEGSEKCEPGLYFSKLVMRE